MLDINEFAKEIHDNARDHGWWEEERKFPEIIALCHSELSEALEEYRAGRPLKWYDCHAPIDIGSVCGERDECGKCCSKPCEYAEQKPEGMAVEMADCIIRILDWCGKEGIDIESILKAKHEYNKTRSYKHGGKKA